MKISQFCLLLKNYYTCSFMYDNPDTEIFVFMPLSDSSQLKEDCLYIWEEDTAVDTANVSGRIVNILVHTEKQSALSEIAKLFPHANLIQAQKNREVPVSSLYGILGDIFLSENRYTSCINRLSQLSASGRGLQALVDLAADLLEAYIIVIDSSYQLLAMSNYREAFDAIDLEEQHKLGALTERNLIRLQREDIFERIRHQPDRMLYNIASDATRWWVNMLVYIHGIEVAEVGIQEVGRKFTEYDFELIKHLRHLISLELQQGNDFGESFAFSHSVLVSELLDQDVKTDLLMYRARLLGWIPHSFYYVLTIFPDSDDNPVPKRFQKQAQLLSMQLQTVMPKSYWRIGVRDLAFIIPRQERDGQSVIENPRLHELLTGNNMTAVLSNPVCDLIKTREAYSQTVILHNLKEFLPPDEVVFQYADHSILHIGSILHQNYSLESFCHPLLLTIRDYDLKYHTDYVKTLYEYLMNINDPAVVADHLNIHKNTIYYRINKMKELFSMDLNDGSLCMKLQLSMEMLNLENALKENV